MHDEQLTAARLECFEIRRVFIEPRRHRVVEYVHVTGVLIIERSVDAVIFDVSHQAVELARCFLAITAIAEEQLWRQASAYPVLSGVRLTKAGIPALAGGRPIA